MADPHRRVPILDERVPDERVLDERIAASGYRLGQPDYAPDRVLHDGVHGEWPGDLPGRLILALAALSELTGRHTDRLGALVDGVERARNRRGYLGPAHDGHDEQQLAGHGWLASGLFAHHRITGDSRSLGRALDIVTELLLPAAMAAETYPRRHRADGRGGPSGSVVAADRGWRLSSDTYCVFIALTGLVDAYAAAPERTIREGIESLLALVDRDDLVVAGAQLHAALTAGRCALQFHELTGSRPALDIAVRIYGLYATHARTTTAAPWNWFQRPDSWTEPCAAVDALMLALGLGRVLADPRYVDRAEELEHNALGHAQKSHGGFGLDTITGPMRPDLATIDPDAAWCCTMRGAVGLVESRLRSLRSDEAGVHVDLFRSGVTQLLVGDEPAVLRTTTAYPLSGRVQVDVLRYRGVEPFELYFRVPAWVDAGAAQLRIGPMQVAANHAPVSVGSSCVFTIPVGIRPQDGSYRHGPLLLGAVDEPDTRVVERGDVAQYRVGTRVLRPVREAFYDCADELTRVSRRVVFDADGKQA